MKFKQIKKAVQENNYILLRSGASNKLIGFNCKVALHREKQVAYDPNARSMYVSYKPCSFMEYITHKVPFK